MKIINKYTGELICKITGNENISLKDAIKKVGYFIQHENPWDPDVLIHQEYTYFSEDLQVVDDDYNAEPIMPWDTDRVEEKSKKISNVRKAVADYKRANGHGPYSSFYGTLMFDRSTGEVWSDEFTNKTSYRVYNDDDIINLGNVIKNHGYDVSEKSVEYYAEKYLND